MLSMERMSTYAKPKTDLFMSHLEILRVSMASLSQAEAMARTLFPGDRASDKSNRSLFMRVFKTPPAAFERAIQQWRHQHYNFTEIDKEVPSIQKRPGMIGNLNATAHRSKSTLARCQSAWNGLTFTEKGHFLSDNGLMFAPEESRSSY